MLNRFGRRASAVFGQDENPHVSPQPLFQHDFADVLHAGFV
jgi:hypothetical protein